MGLKRSLRIVVASIGWYVLYLVALIVIPSETEFLKWWSRLTPGTRAEIERWTSNLDYYRDR